MFTSKLSPVLLNLGPFEIRYYGLFYILGFILSYFILKHLSKKGLIKLTDKKIEDLLVYAGVSGIICARIFYVLVYNLSYYVKNPFEIIAVWHGGLSIHGGIIGGLFGIYLFGRKYKCDFLHLLDASIIPFALAAGIGRFGNFFNAELYGPITSVPWCVNFPNVIGCRHPWPIYDAISNFIVFGLLWALKDKKLKKGTIFSSFLIFYSISRFLTEFVRVPDPQLGYLIFGLTMGQILNVIMFTIGIFLILSIYRKKHA